MINIALAVVGPLVLAYLWVAGRRGGVRQQPGWRYMLVGLGLVLFGIIMGMVNEMVDPEGSLNIAGMQYPLFLEKVLGYCAGFLLLAIGLGKMLQNLRKFTEEQKAFEYSRQKLIKAMAEYRWVEEKLRKSEERYRGMVNYACDGICVVRNGLIEYANPHIEHITGYPPSQMVGKPIMHYIHPEEITAFADFDNHCKLNGGHTGNYESAFAHKNGKRIDVEISGGSVALDDKSESFLIIRDITGRTEALEDLRKQEELLKKRNAELLLSQQELARQNLELSSECRVLEGFFENSDVAILHLSKDSKIINLNPKSEAIFGENRQGLLGKKFVDLSLFECLDKNKKTEMQLLVDGAAMGESLSLKELEVKWRNGAPLFMDMFATPLDKEAISKGLLVTLKDITGYKKRLLESRKARVGLEAVAHEHSLMVSKLERQLSRHPDNSNGKGKSETFKILEAKLMSLQECTPDFVITVDRTGRALSVNRTLPGVTPEEVIGRSIFDHIAPEYHQAIQRNLELVFDSGIIARNRVIGTGPHNTYSWYEIRMAPIKISKSKPVAATLVYSDISRRVSSEEALKKADQRFRDMANMLPQTVFEVDLNGNFTFANSFGLQNIGYIQQDIDSGMNALQMFAPKDRDRVMADIEKVLIGQESGEHEYTLIKKDETILPVLAHISPIIESGKIAGMRGIILDITERKRAEDEIRRRNVELAALNAIAQKVNQSVSLGEILGHALDKVMESLNFDHGGVYLLEGDEDHLALKVERCIGDFPEKALSEIPINEGIASKLFLTGEAIFDESASEDLTLLESDAQKAKAFVCVPLQARDKLLGIMFGTNHEKRPYPEEERGLIGTIANAISTAIENVQLLEIESKAMALEEADKLRNAFLASISHEMRTPLTSIKGIASTLIQPDVEWDAETQREFLQIIDRESNRLVRIVNDILDMSLIEAGVMVLEKKPVTINRVIRNLTPKLDSSKLKNELKLSVDEDLPAVLMDEKRIEQAIINLIENAAAYSPEGSQINIEASVTSTNLVVAIADQSEGLKPDQIERIFDHFYRIEENTDRRLSGSGLGLAISRGIISAHLGNIWAENEPGQGLRISFTLPLSTGQKSPKKKSSTSVVLST